VLTDTLKGPHEGVPWVASGLLTLGEEQILRAMRTTYWQYFEVREMRIQRMTLGGSSTDIITVIK